MNKMFRNYDLLLVDKVIFFSILSAISFTLIMFVVLMLTQLSLFRLSVFAFNLILLILICLIILFFLTLILLGIYKFIKRMDQDRSPTVIFAAFVVLLGILTFIYFAWVFWPQCHCLMKRLKINFPLHDGSAYEC